MEVVRQQNLIAIADLKTTGTILYHFKKMQLLTNGMIIDATGMTLRELMQIIERETDMKEYTQHLFGKEATLVQNSATNKIVMRIQEQQRYDVIKLCENQRTMDHLLSWLVEKYPDEVNFYLEIRPDWILKPNYICLKYNNVHP